MRSITQLKKEKRDIAGCRVQTTSLFIELGSTGQSRPERASEDHTRSHLSAADRSWEHEEFLQKITRHAHTARMHTHTQFGQWHSLLRTSIVCSVVFIYKKRDELSRHLCSALFLSSHLCWGTLLFSHGPPLTGSWPPMCHPLKKILESLLLDGDTSSSNSRLRLVLLLLQLNATKIIH